MAIFSTRNVTCAGERVANGRRPSNIFVSNLV